VTLALRWSVAANVLLLAALTVLVADRASVESERTEANRRSADLEIAVKHLEFERDSWRKLPGEGPGRSPPFQAGRVLDADDDVNAIVINLGADDGVEEGFRFTVSRSARYVAELVITHVEKERAIGRTLARLSKEPVRVGDDVTTSMAPR